ncbi:hypothetical protein, partial [Cupriavidus sp. 8B]
MFTICAASLQIQRLNVKRSKARKVNCLTSKTTAVSPPLRGGDLLSCLAKKVGKEGDPDGAKD